MATSLINSNLSGSKFVSLTDYFRLGGYQNAGRQQKQWFYTKLINITYRYQKLLASLHKPKRSTAVDRFVPVFGLTSSSLNIHELTATDRYDLDSFPSPLDLGPSSMSLRIIKRLGTGQILVATLAVFLSCFCSARHLYTDQIYRLWRYDHVRSRFNDIHDHVIGYNQR